MGGCRVVYCPDTTHVRPTSGKDHWMDAQLSTALTPHMSDPPLGRITGWMHSYLQPWHHTCQTHHWEGSLGGCTVIYSPDTTHVRPTTGEGSLGGWRVVYCPDTTHVRPTTWRDYGVDAVLFTGLTLHMSDPPLGGITGWMRGRLLPWYRKCQTHQEEMSLGWMSLSVRFNKWVNRWTSPLDGPSNKLINIWVLPTDGPSL